MRCALLVLLVCIALPAGAQERILRHDVDVRVRADGRLDVTERIEVRAEGRAFRHGLVRDFPVRYRDPQGDLVVSELQVQDVRRDGRVEPWRVERVGRVRRLSTGDAGHLEMPSQPVYTLHYRTRRQPLFGETQDVLSLEAIGTEQLVPVEQGSVTVTLPRAVAIDALHADGMTGTAGRDVHVALSAAGSARWTLARPLQPHEGLHVRLAFPKGVIAPPTWRQRSLWWLHDHAGLLAALTGLMLLAAYGVGRWRRVRQPLELGAVSNRHEPPPGFSPAGLRYLRRMRYDARGFAADLLASAVDDHLCILRQPQGARTGWRIQRTHEGAHTLPTMEQRAQLSALLPEPRDAVDLRGREQARIAQACRAHETALRKRCVPALFRAHGGSILVALGIAMTSAAVALWLAWHSPALMATILAVALMAPMLIVFALLVRAPTADGRQLLAHAEGLRRYLVGAAQARRRHEDIPGAPPLDAARYLRLLPYAVALDAEDAWTRAFAAQAGTERAIEAIAGIPWYRGIVVTDLARFSRSMGDSLSARIAATARPKKKRRSAKPSQA